MSLCMRLESDPVRRVVYAACAGSGSRGSGRPDRRSRRRVSCGYCVSQCVTMFGAVALVLVGIEPGVRGVGGQ